MTSEEIKSSMGMRAVAEEYGLKVNRNGFACCPFHKEKTPSMKIYKDSFHCFGCGASGDVFSFVMQMEKCDFKTAYKRLGGSYRAKSDYEHKVYRYQQEKRKETRLNELRRINGELRDTLEELRLKDAILVLTEVMSKDWCDAFNRKEYLLYKMEELIKEKNQYATIE